MGSGTQDDATLILTNKLRRYSRELDQSSKKMELTLSHNERDALMKLISQSIGERSHYYQADDTSDSLSSILSRLHALEEDTTKIYPFIRHEESGVPMNTECPGTPIKPIGEAHTNSSKEIRGDVEFSENNINLDNLCDDEEDPSSPSLSPVKKLGPQSALPQNLDTQHILNMACDVPLHMADSEKLTIGDTEPEVERKVATPADNEPGIFSRPVNPNPYQDRQDFIICNSPGVDDSNRSSPEVKKNINHTPNFGSTDPPFISKINVIEPEIHLAPCPSPFPDDVADDLESPLQSMMGTPSPFLACTVPVIPPRDCLSPLPPDDEDYSHPPRDCLSPLPPDDTYTTSTVSPLSPRVGSPTRENEVIQECRTSRGIPQKSPGTAVSSTAPVDNTMENLIQSIFESEIKSSSSISKNINEFIRKCIHLRLLEKEREPILFHEYLCEWNHAITMSKFLIPGLEEITHISSVLKSFASIGYSNYQGTEFYLRLLGELPRIISHASTVATTDEDHGVSLHQLIKILRCMVKLRLREISYLDMIGIAIIMRVIRYNEELTQKMLVQVSNSLAALDIRSNTRLMDFIFRQITFKIERMSGDIISQFSLCFIIQFCNHDIRKLIIARMAETEAGLGKHEKYFPNVALVVTALKKEHFTFAAQLDISIVRYLEKINRRMLWSDEMSLVSTIVLPQRPGMQRTDTIIRQQIRTALQQRLISKHEGHVWTSQFHQEVSTTLSDIGIAHENGVPFEHFLLDIVAMDLHNNFGERIIIECNAEHHFYNDTKILTQERKLRHSLLRRSGLKIILIDQFRWDTLKQPQRLTFLCDHLGISNLDQFSNK